MRRESQDGEEGFGADRTRASGSASQSDGVGVPLVDKGLFERIALVDSAADDGSLFGMYWAIRWLHSVRAASSRRSSST